MKARTLLNKSQVSRSELSRLTKFSRPTIQRWLEQDIGPRRHTDSVFYTGILAALSKALSEGELPLPMNLTSAERDKRIKSIVKQWFDIDDIQRLIA